MESNVCSRINLAARIMVRTLRSRSLSPAAAMLFMVLCAVSAFCQQITGISINTARTQTPNTISIPLRFPFPFTHSNHREESVLHLRGIGRVPLQAVDRRSAARSV